MINYNGKLVKKESSIFTAGFRGLKYGDGVFETLRVKDGKVVFFEDHYFRLMASMRLLRMEIPMTFTMDFMEDEIIRTVTANNFDQSRVRFSVYRDATGLYAPVNSNIIYLIECAPFDTSWKENVTVDIYKDHLVHSQMLSTIKTTNRMVNILAAIYARENEYDNCILLNEHKHVVEFLNGNLFLIVGHEIRTPALTEGCIKGIMRKKVIDYLKNHPELEIKEMAISPFDLLKADEMFITNSIIGVQQVNRYRKKEFNTAISQEIRAAVASLI